MTVRVLSSEFREVTWRLREPLRTARATYDSRRGIVIHLRTTHGDGVGEATPLTEFGTEDFDRCREAVRLALVFLVEKPIPTDLPALRAMTSAIPRRAARHGVELALLDAIARARNLPVARLLNPAAPLEVPVNALVTTEPRALWSEGYRVFKLKVAAGDDDEARVSALRAALPDAEIRIDANGGWTLPEALAQLRTFARHRVALCEQPVAADDLDGLEELARTSPIPIAADESFADAAQRERIIAMPGLDAVIIKPMVIGGLLTSRELALRAIEAGKRVIVTGSLDGRVARTGAAHLAASLPAIACGLSMRLLDEEDHVHHGMITLRDVPGLGVEG